LSKSSPSRSQLTSIHSSPKSTSKIQISTKTSRNADLVEENKIEETYEDVNMVTNPEVHNALDYM
jgi:hypothetical protein